MKSVALLRGVNVGGKNTLPMKELVALCEALGARDVSTYIQSGNVVGTFGKGFAKKLAAALDAIGLSVPVITRTAPELVAIAEAQPFTAPKETLHVVFLDGAARATLDPDRSPPDRFVVAKREIYLCCPNGYGRTKLTNAWFDAQLSTTSTVRNWKTLEALIALTT